MASTIEDLEKRFTALEMEVAALKEQNERRLATETSAERGTRQMREAKANRAADRVAWEQAFKQMGITGPPVGAEKLQEMMRAAGMDPNSTEFSQGIIEMREE